MRISHDAGYTYLYVLPPVAHRSGNWSGICAGGIGFVVRVR